MSGRMVIWVVGTAVVGAVLATGLAGGGLFALGLGMGFCLGIITITTATDADEKRRKR